MGSVAHFAVIVTGDEEDLRFAVVDAVRDAHPLEQHPAGVDGTLRVVVVLADVMEDDK